MIHFLAHPGVWFSAAFLIGVVGLYRDRTAYVAPVIGCVILGALSVGQ